MAFPAGQGMKLPPYGTGREAILGRLLELGRAAGAVSRSFAAEADRWFFWLPVLLATGIATYFGLPFEPPLWIPLSATAILASALWTLRHRQMPLLVLSILTAIVAGSTAASLRTAITAAPVLREETAGALTGRVLSVEEGEAGDLTALMTPTSFAHLRPEDLPDKVRLRIRLKGVTLHPGETVRLRVRLMPPPEPVLPGGFDYARQAWFEGLGAVGFAYTTPEIIEPSAGGPAAAIAALRNAIATRIRAVIGGPGGAVAAALVTGERRAIPASVTEDLRAAGLAHVLAISGLHMALFSGTLFWLARALFAAVPALSLRYPVKKWAALVAFAGASFYLLVSGGAIATQRAFIMVALMLASIMLDRPAISLRNVALAAIIVLLWQPESLLGASFQMSFAAAVALVAFYESRAVQRFIAVARGDWREGPAQWPRLVLLYFAGLTLTSLVAGLATAPFAAFNFNRLALYGLAGNLAAMPLVGLIIMPSALIGLMLMPFGADGPAFWVMGKGIEWMLEVAHDVAHWGGADRLLPAAPLSALALVTFGGLWIALWRRDWRWLGCLPLLCGLILWPQAARPDILIGRDGDIVGARGNDGYLYLTSARPSYTAEQWLRVEGDRRRPAEAAAQDGSLWHCDVRGCAVHEAGRPLVAYSKDISAVTEDCEVADVIIAAVPVGKALRKGCRATLILDYFDFWRDGATTIRLGERDGPEVNTTRAARGARPWVRQPWQENQ